MKRVIIFTVLLCMIWGCLSCIDKEENKVTDIYNIIKSIPPEYKKQKEINGVLRDTYFFATWDGYHHPIHMQKPLSYIETQHRKNGTGYYEASLDISGNEPLLIFVEQVIVFRELLSIKNTLKDRKEGSLYYRFNRVQGHVVLDKARMAT